MSHIAGQHDHDLHHEDGSHRTTARTANGSDLERHEARIRRHLEAHRRQEESEPTGGKDHDRHHHH